MSFFAKNPDNFVMIDRNNYEMIIRVLIEYRWCMNLWRVAFAIMGVTWCWNLKTKNKHITSSFLQ